MGKINQIQNTLKELSEGKFQKLADAYLVAKKIGIVNSVGSVIGSDKTRKGSPDALIMLPNGNYALAEHTTQKTRLLEKLKGDFNDCFDEEKTGVPVERIDQVILCFNSKLDTTEVNELQELAEEKRVQLRLFGIDALSYDIVQAYPNLARQYLNLGLDTGQIVSVEEFVSLHSREKMAAGIDQSFFFREEELGRMLSTLEQENMVILTGGAGVGKTRLALEICKRFREQHTEYQAWCVFGRNINLWEDLQIYFRGPGDYLILVDDANMLSRFEYVVDLLLDKWDDRKVKVVVTVRDYALKKISEAASKVSDEDIWVVKPFTDEQIREFLKEEFGIKNYRYIKRIVGIAKGNPRLAVMAANAAITGGLKSIHNVTELYEDFFSSIKGGLLNEDEDLDIDRLIKVAAIISFFEAVDLTNAEMMTLIEKTFGFDPQSFREAAQLLHHFELADMYKNEVIRIQDQVLGTYCFHRAFFKDELLSFGLLLQNLFPQLKERIILSINSTTIAFEGQKIVNDIKPAVGRIWSDLEKKGISRDLLELIDAFWATDPTKALLWTHKQIENMENQPAADGSGPLESDDSIPYPSVLSILSRFADAEESDARKALDLLMQYLQKRPDEFPRALFVITHGYGYDENSWEKKYVNQHAAVDVIWERAEEGDALFYMLFLKVAGKYLETHVHSFRDAGKRKVEILDFGLQITPELLLLREKIWRRLFCLYEYEKVQDDVLKAIIKYTKIPRREFKREVAKEDMEHILPFLEIALNADNYWHCIIGNAYLDFLNDHGIDAPDGARDRYKHETYELAKVLLMDWGDRRTLGLSIEEFDKLKKEQLGKHTEDYRFDDYVRFFKSCDEIRHVMEESKEDVFNRGVSDTLLTLANRDIDLCVKVLGHYLSLVDPVKLNGYPIINSFIEQRGPEEVFSLFIRRKYRKNKCWLFHIHELMPVESITKKKLKHLYRLYRTTDKMELPRGLDYLLKYRAVDPRVIPKVVATVIKKTKKDPAYAYTLLNLFNHHAEVGKILPALFVEDTDLLKQAYLYAEHYAELSDHKGQFFAIMMNLDQEFLLEYLGWKYKTSEKRWLSSYDIGRDYEFLWGLVDYQKTISKAVEYIYELEQGGFSSLDPILGSFFGGEKREKIIMEETLEKQDNFLLLLIDERYEDVDFIRYLFRVISSFSPGRRTQFVERFVSKNDDIEAFKRLRLEPSDWSWSGSRVPLLQEQIDYWESMLLVMTSVDLLEHKQFIECQIQRLKNQIEREKKSDFIEDRP